MKKQSLLYCSPAERRPAADELHVAVAEAVDLAAPLRLERRRADDQHLLDLGLARQELGRPDPLDRLAEPHVVGQDRPAGAGGEGDAVELVRQQRDLEQRLAQRMSRRVAADLRGLAAQAFLKQALLDELLGVGIDRHVLAELLQLRQALQQVVQVGDRHVAERGDDLGNRLVHLRGSQQPERHLVPVVAQVQRQVLAAIRLSELLRP